VPLLFGILHHVFKNGWEDKEYIRTRVYGMDEVKKEVMAKWTPDKVTEATGCSEAEIANIAKTRGVREGRSQPFSALAKDDGASVPESWFRGADDRWPGGWTTFPNDWRGIPEDRLLAGETLHVVGEAIESLPPLQAEVIRLRDVLGWTSEEVRNVLDLSETNQRVLLHRARAKVRSAVEEHLRSVTQ